MKKVSIVAARQRKTFSQPTLTIGLDLGDRNSWYCVLDEVGQIQLEQRVRTSAKTLQEVFSGMPGSRIALEIGTHSPWISRLLSELGDEVIVANARKVRLIGESRKKDDRLDARTLARLARIDPELLYPVQHRSAQAQADLAVIRARAGLVRARTSLVNTARNLTKSYGERLRGCNVRNLNPEKAECLSPELQSALEPLLGEIESLSERIAEYNDRIEALAEENYPQVKLSATHSRTIWQRLRSQALGPEASRAWRQERKEASHCGYGKKASGVVASSVGERGSVRAIAQQQADNSGSCCLKRQNNSKSFQEEKRSKLKAEFR